MEYRMNIETWGRFHFTSWYVTNRNSQVFWPATFTTGKQLAKLAKHRRQKEETAMARQQCMGLHYHRPCSLLQRCRFHRIPYRFLSQPVGAIKPQLSSPEKKKKSATDRNK